jgi:hypothetical protein
MPKLQGIHSCENLSTAVFEVLALLGCCVALMVCYQPMACYPRRAKTSIELQWKPKILHEQLLPSSLWLLFHHSVILAAENALLNMLPNVLVSELLIS